MKFSPSELKIKEELKDWPSMFDKYAQSDRKKAILQIITSFGPFIALWVLMYYSLNWSYWITFGLAMLNAFFMVRIFIIQHDCGHRSYFKSQKWNRFIGWVCSVFTIIPFKYWSNVHAFHHGHSGQLEVRDIGDIQFMTVEEFKNASKGKRLGYRIFRMPIITFVIGPMVYLLYNNRLPLVEEHGGKSVNKWLQLNNFILLSVYLLMGWLLGWTAFFFIQMSIIFFFGIIAIWFFFVQHQHEHSYKHWQDNWDYLLSAIKGSTFYRLPKLVHWLTGNIGYHHIHHLNSKIPSYNLPRCARENPILQKHATSVTFFKSLECMFNKLWDEQTQRMITFREFYQNYGKELA